MGTMILLGVTAALVGVAAVQLHSRQPAAEAPSLDVMVLATPGAGSLTLLHAGGPTLAADGLRVVVDVDGTTWYDAPFPSGGDWWALGESRDVPLPGPLPEGARVETSVAPAPHDAVVSTVVVRVPGAAAAGAPPAGFAVDASFGPEGEERNVTTPGHAFLEADVAHPGGRKLVAAVYADLSQIDGSAAHALLDRGTGGDVVAGDGVWSATVLVPAGLSDGDRAIPVTAVDFDGAVVTDVLTLTVNGTGSGGSSGDGSDGGDGGDGSDGSGSDGSNGTDGSDGAGWDWSQWNRPVYDETLVESVGIRLFKYPESTQKSMATVHFKVKLQQEPFVKPDGSEWTFTVPAMDW